MNPVNKILGDVYSKRRDYKEQLLDELKETKGYHDSRSVAIRESRKQELKRLNVKIPRGY